jgi:hypothetical protein
MAGRIADNNLTRNSQIDDRCGTGRCAGLPLRDVPRSHALWRGMELARELLYAFADSPIAPCCLGLSRKARAGWGPKEK